jgi:hypothetical protein
LHAALRPSLARASPLQGSHLHLAKHKSTSLDPKNEMRSVGTLLIGALLMPITSVACDIAAGG